MRARALDFVEKMRRDKDRLATLSQRDDQLADLAPFHRDRARWPVRRESRAADRQATWRQWPGAASCRASTLELVLPPAQEPTSCQRTLDGLVPNALEVGHDAEVVPPAEIRIEVGRLERRADLLSAACGPFPPGEAEEANFTRRRGDDVRAAYPMVVVFPQPLGREAEDLSRLDGEGDAVDGEDLAIPLGEPAGLDDTHGGGIGVDRRRQDGGRTALVSHPPPTIDSPLSRRQRLSVSRLPSPVSRDVFPQPPRHRPRAGVARPPVARLVQPALTIKATMELFGTQHVLVQRDAQRGGRGAKPAPMGNRLRAPASSCSSASSSRSSRRC